MSNISVNITELKQLLEATPASHNIMLVGNHGIGKSEILTEFFKDKGMSVIALFLGQMADPGDLIGLPCKDEKTGKTDFMPPYWFPIDGKPIVLFLDELNRARPEILQTVMDLALNRKLAGKLLPEGSRIISAVNSGDQYQLTDLDPALVSRFNIVNFKPTAEEWLLWARKAQLDPRVIGFIDENRIWLDKEPDMKEGADTGLDKTPDRRAWKRVSDVITGKDDLKEINTKTISSIVGPKAAAAFIHNAATKRILSGREILAGFDKAKVRETLAEYGIHQLSVVNEGIYRHLEVEKVQDKDVKTYTENLMSYFEFLTKKRKEAAAHFANIYVQGTYENALSFIATKAPMLGMMLVSYVKGIK
ncbi:MAG: AAA family ATPase [Bacteroidales bacterium]|nr:AAA family ATPase [Bacteroidales bacterium]